MVFAVTSAVACGHCLLRPPFVGKLGPEEVASVPVRGLQGAVGGGWEGLTAIAGKFYANWSSNLSSVTNVSHNLGQDLAALWTSVSPSVQWGVGRGALTIRGSVCSIVWNREGDSPPLPCALTTKRVFLSPE